MAFLRLTILLIILAARPAHAQESELSRGAWNTVVQQDSVRLSYIFYPRADNANNGIVLRVDNYNAFTVQYSFLAIFRAGGEEITERVAGRVGPKTLVTGDVEGLFFIPFPDGRAIEELGIRGFGTARVDG